MSEIVQHATPPSATGASTKITMPREMIKLEAREVSVNFGNTRVLKQVSMPIPEHQVTALMGPSGSGKSTFLRALNRMHDRTLTARVTGEVWLDGQNILLPTINTVQLRRRLGMIFQRPIVFPKSIFDNVAFALQV